MIFKTNNDVGWISKARMKTIRTEPTWSGSPDIVISIISKDRTEAEAQNNIKRLMQAGALEVWVVYPNGNIAKFKINERELMTSPDFKNVYQ